jgi:hypothetical protein
MIIPALKRPGETCWVGVRNPIENPDHATGEPKLRPAILVRLQGDGWVVIGTTSRATYSSGTPRLRIPSDLWEDAHPGLPRRAGYLWGSTAPWVRSEDVGSHIGWAIPPLRAFAVRHAENVAPKDRNAFLRLRPDELAEADGESP